MGKPFFSIIVPIYNASKYLEECVMSVMTQDTDDFELILVDDGSTDESATICDALSKKFGQIRTFHKENGGPIHSRLFGLKQARGVYCIHLDADDYLEKHTVSYLKKIFQNYECDCIIFGFRSVVNQKVLRVFTVDEDCFSSNKHDIYTNFFSSYVFNALWRKAYKIDCVDYGDMSRYYHIHKGEDALLSLGVIRCCKSVFFSKEILYNYRMNEESITHRKEPLPDFIEFTVPEILLQFVTQEAKFNEMEMNEYRKVRYREFFVPLIKKIATSEASAAKKVELFSSIRKTKYYRQFLCKKILHCSNGIVELSMLALFRCGFDHMLISILQSASKLKTNWERNNKNDI